MKIALASFIVSSEFSGMGRWTRRVAEGLRRRGHEVTELDATSLGCDIRSPLERHLFGAKLVRALLAAPDHFDVAVIHEPHALPACLLRKLTKTSVVVMSHGVENRIIRELRQATREGAADTYPDTVSRHWVLWGWREALAFRLSDHVLCLAEVDREFLARSRGDPSTVSSFTNGADPVPEPFDPGAANGVLCVGTWIPEKGSKVLPRIWSLLRAQEPSVKLTVAGTGVSADAVRQSFSPQDRHTVEVVPEFRGSTELEPLLRDAAVFLLPSLREGSPLALLEAMSHGLPIVASTVGGVPDVVRDGTDGFLYSALETGRAAELVHRLLGSVDLRRRLGSAARARADSLTWDRATSAVERACQLASEVVH